MNPPLLVPVRGAFRALACTFVPEMTGLDERGWADAEAICESFLASKPDAIRRQVLFLIRLLDFLPRLRWGRRFTALDAERRRRFLEALQNAPLLLLRRGVWGLRTIAFMGFYARPEAATAIGYRADKRGWDAR